MRSLKLVAAAALGLITAPAGAQTQAAAPAATAPAAIDYSQEASWLCLPGRPDACGTPLATTALNANGYGSNGQSVPDKAAKIDCFYVYPTVSRDAGFNSDMVAGPEEQAVALVQFARFSTVCRPHAPLYRQLTLAGLAAVFSGQQRSGDWGLAYGDVLAAWRHFLKHRNQGRPFVLVGHSQGSLHLTRLLAEEIEGKPAAKRMLSAMLLGSNVEVPEGKTVGGSFKKTPLCTKAGQKGCVISYVSFRAEAPPPEKSWFGRAAKPGMTVACTNPAALKGGSAKLDSYWFTAAPPAQGAPTIAWSSQGAPPTPFLRTEGLVSASCVNRGNVGYLAVTTNADPADVRTDRIPGDVYVMGKLQPGWGLHLADVNLALGDLVWIVEEQAASSAASAAAK
jgi:hypothetical protein